MEQTQKVYKNRKDIPEQYRWKTEDIYANEELWEKDFKAIPKYLEEIQKFQGRVIESADNLFQTLKLKEQALELLERVNAYAMLHRDENTIDQHYQGLSDRVTALRVEAGSKLSFIVPEILKLTEKEINSFLKEKEDLKTYQHFLDNLLRQKEHFRSPEEEQIIALSGEMAAAPQNIFSLLTNADMEFPEINVEGEKVRLTQGNFIEFLQNQNRDVRSSAHKAMYQTYSAKSNTLGATYSSSIKGDLFQARVRNYNSALEAALEPDNIPVSLYEKLLEIVHNHLPALHRYVNLKKKSLKLNEFRPYDLYVPLTGESQWKPLIDEAKETVLNGLKVMGEEYTTLLKTSFEERWMDVYETRGKRSGAYSLGIYGTHPFVLLNYQPSLDSVFTIAHELGHALHSYYTNKTQPYIYSHYPIFLAEVASTVNESLLFNYLLAKAEGKEKAALLEKNLEQFRAVIFRQVLFAEFEKQVHELAESGQPLTPEKFNEVYGQLLEKYYGPNFIVDDYIRGEWARIPHFYSAFYVYKYATGFSSAVAISEMILNEGTPAIENYINFLTSGDSDYPLDTLRRAGVDLTNGEPINAALRVFEQRLQEFEEIMVPVDF